MKRNLKILSVLLVLIVILPNVAQAKSLTPDVVERISGKDRIQTAIEASKIAYEKSDTVVLAGYSGEVDALTGTLLAGHEGAPLLLTRKDGLTDDLKNELKRLKPKNIFILGGEAVVSKNVENELKEDYKVERIAGNTRYETAVKIANKVKGETADHIFLALGYGELADALSIGPVSAMREIPVLLTQQSKIPNETKSALTDLKVRIVTIIGGESAVSKSLVKDLENIGVKVDRIAGARRTETAIKIADKYFPKPKDSYSSALVAYGWNYADALVGGYLGAILESPILLTDGNKLSVDTKEYITNKIKKTYVLGGKAVIGESVVDEIGWATPVFKNLPNGGYIQGYGGDYENPNTGEPDPSAAVWGIDNSGEAFSVYYSRRTGLDLTVLDTKADLEKEDYDALVSIMEKEFDEWAEGYE